MLDQKTIDENQVAPLEAGVVIVQLNGFTGIDPGDPNNPWLAKFVDKDTKEPKFPYGLLRANFLDENGRVHNKEFAFTDYYSARNSGNADPEAWKSTLRLTRDLKDMFRDSYGIEHAEFDETFVPRFNDDHELVSVYAQELDQACKELEVKAAPNKGSLVLHYNYRGFVKPYTERALCFKQGEANYTDGELLYTVSTYKGNTYINRAYVSEGTTPEPLDGEAVESRGVTVVPCKPVMGWVQNYMVKSFDPFSFAKMTVTPMEYPMWDGEKEVLRPTISIVRDFGEKQFMYILTQYGADKPA